MRLRNKILLYFSFTSIIIFGVALLSIYFLLEDYRQEDFRKRQKDKIITTLKLLSQVEQTKQELIEELDQLTINDLHDEKLLLFDSEKHLIYSSLDDTPILVSKNILEQLNSRHTWVEAEEESYDVVGVYVERSGKEYYGISKAYDAFGHSKIIYLKYILISTFIFLIVITVVVSFYLARKITQPLMVITQKIDHYDFGTPNTSEEIASPKDELTILEQKFNQLMKRMNEAFTFQKHAIHHISHELKTPIAILVSNFEKIEQETDLSKLKQKIQDQKKDTKDLSDIINSMLEIAKIETFDLTHEQVRVDELIFDISEELQKIYTESLLSIDYVIEDENNDLIIQANASLLKAVFMNLIQNAIQYSEKKQVKILIQAKFNEVVISIENKGTIIQSKEQSFLFQHFFRGQNSKGKRGFGLGLVFVYKIITRYNGKVYYESLGDHTNIFTVHFPKLYDTSSQEK